MDYGKSYETLQTSSVYKERAAKTIKDEIKAIKEKELPEKCLSWDKFGRKWFCH